jgi:hypothetical protein
MTIANSSFGDRGQSRQLGAGHHYLQEDHAEVIGSTVNQWLIDLGVISSPKYKVAS